MSVLVRRKKRITECDGGMGNPTPASSAAMTAVDQSSAECIGSGDAFGFNMPMSTKSEAVKIKKHKQ